MQQTSTTGTSEGKCNINLFSLPLDILTFVFVIRNFVELESENIFDFVLCLEILI